MLEQIIDVILHTLLSITSMFLLTKLLGKRQLSEMSLFGYISGITIGNIAAYIALEHDQRYLAVVCLVTWGLFTYLLERLTLKSYKLRRIVDGTPRMLVEDGVVYRDAFKKELLTVDEFLEQLHDIDVYRIEDVQTATIEASGDITVLLKTDRLPITPATLGIKMEIEKEPITIIVDGHWQQEKMDEKHLKEEHFTSLMKNNNIDLKDVFIAQAYDKNTVYFCFMNGQSKLVNDPQDQQSITINELKGILIKLNQFLKQYEQ